jgi:ParB family chromosome partitioning protein
MVSKFVLNTNKSAATNAAINRTLEIANNYAGELTIEVLPLDKIELDPENNRDMVLTLSDAMHGISKDDPQFERKNEDWKSLESLSKTIKDDQLINPIFVYRFGNKCRLIAGERRTLASAIAGKKEIIARIANERPVGTKLRVLQWIENNERQDLSLAERIASIQSIVESYLSDHSEKNSEKVTASVLSNLTGMSLTQCKRYNLILNANQNIKNAVFSGKIENIKLIELICAEENEKNQNFLLNAAIAGQSFDKISTLKKELQLNRNQIKRTSGRRQEGVLLGRISPNVIKKMIEALVSSDAIDGFISEKINMISVKTKWNEGESISRSFKQIAALLEQESKVPA